MKRMVREMNKMIRELVKMKRKVNGFEEEATDPQLIPEDSEEQNHDGEEFSISEIIVPVDIKSKYYAKFSVVGHNIKFESEEADFTQILINKVIPFGRVYKFTIKITNSKNNKIHIGIVNKERIRKRSSFSSGEAFTYYGYNGWVCDKKTTVFETYDKKGNGFRTSDDVIVTVDLSKGMVEWAVGERLMASQYRDLLRKQKHTFVPDIAMCDRGDSVRWVS